MSLRTSFFLSFVSFVCFVVPLPADPLTKQLEIDFGRDVPSRNLKGLATRSDGRIVPGPAFTELAGPAIADILWCAQPAGDGRFLVGTGPEGKIFEVTLAAPGTAATPPAEAFTVKLLGRADETQVFALLRLPNGDVLAGTSPAGAIYLFRDGKAVARVAPPVDSVFSFLPLPDGAVLAATGNPGLVYRLDPTKFAAAGINAAKIADAAALAEKGLTVFGEIRDRNVRRLARLASGRIVAGSAPKGNIYAFAAAGGPPVILLENRDLEVVDLLPLPDGSFYAALVSSGITEDKRLTTRPPGTPAPDANPPAPFAGRSNLAWFPVDAFPEIVVARNNVAFYRLAEHDGRILISGGEQGDFFGYDPKVRHLLTFAGSTSAQLNEILPLAPGRFLLLRNNAPGLALVEFNAPGPRELETRRLDLGSPTELGNLRISRLRGLDAAALSLQARVSNGSDELEGWSPWTALTARDGGFAAPALRGRYVRVKLSLASGAPAAFEIDKAQLYHLPQNRRPLLTEFRIFAPGLGLIPAPEPTPPAVLPLSQVVNPPQGDAGGDKRKAAFLNSQVINQPGNRIVLWTVTDPDGDTLAYTFSLRPDHSDQWTDLAVKIPASYVQFDTTALPDGIYLTRLVAAEQSPRPASQRQSYTFETDNLVVDRTPPVILDATAARTASGVSVKVTGRDALSLLYGVELNFNNGYKEGVEHPADGILDSREETFAADVPAGRIAGATSVEVLLYDAAGNSTARRLALP
jgi:hypothetical protein